MAPPSATSAKRPLAPGAAELPLAQERAVTKKNGQSQQQKLECPRCSSSDTKFCYYNNYSTAQPRHFCRTCRRYWTHGGTLRTVPVGGSGISKRRRTCAEPYTPSSDTLQPNQEERPLPDLPLLLPDLPLPVFPFFTNGSVFLPQFDLGLGGFPWTSAATKHLYDRLAAPWGGCDAVLGPTGGGATGAWEDYGGLELTWPPPPPHAGVSRQHGSSTVLASQLPRSIS